jgi:hypothetical protein
MIHKERRQQLVEKMVLILEFLALYDEKGRKEGKFTGGENR